MKSFARSNDLSDLIASLSPVHGLIGKPNKSLIISDC